MNENYSISEEVEEVMPSFFWTIASSEGHQLINKDELVRIIKFDEMTKNHTELYRKQVPISKALADNTKLMMPGITASALMDGQGKQVANILKPTYWLAVDIDKIPEEKMQEVITKVDKDPYVMARYVTASGHGLRILARYKPFDDPEVTAVELFDVVVRKAMDYFSILLGVPADEKCCDITRMCGLAHDPTAYFCWNSKPFELESKDIKRLYFKKSMAEKYERRSSRRRKPSQKMVSLAKHIPTIDEAAASIEKLLETWGKAFEPSRHNDYVYNFGLTCLKYDIDQKEATDYADQHFSAQYPKTVSVMNQAYKHQEQRGTWQFMRKGESYGKKPSMKMLKQWLSMRYEFHRNEVTGYYEVCSRDVLKGKFHHWTRMDDNIENSLWIEMEEDGLQTQQPRLHSLINSDFSKKYNPLLDYLTALPAWDGKTDYIQMLADRIHIANTDGAHHTQEDFRYFFKKWFVAMVVTWVTDTVVGQTILIFVGKGGLFKTTFFDKLLPKILHDYFINESTASYTDKDFMEAMASKALMCLDEFETAFGKNLSAFKSCVTKLFFSIRRPYDKYRTELPHRAAMCGTSNSVQIISEEENRRYSPWLIESIDSPIDHPIDYQHVYAQAVALGKEVMERQRKHEDGWVFWLTTEDIEVMREHNKMFMISNYMEDQILRYYRVPGKDVEARYIKFRYSSEILERIGGCPALSRYIYQQNLASTLLRLGFERKRRSKGMGWFVIEKEVGEMNTDAIVSPSEWEDDRN
ncbi:BT4734/BF3469 family protein [Segatella copri]|uniref:BT4734/BF3469 family protein n=1 Tax=Segatella copri TaxID=165179 RepID=UPI00294B4FA9|nr:BT4734/BF3469 family protein [Segatella copri]